MVAGELALGVRHKGHLVYRQAALAQVVHTIHQVVKGVALNVEFSVRPGLEQFGQLHYILRPDVPRIGTRMHRDTRSTRL